MSQPASPAPVFTRPLIDGDTVECPNCGGRGEVVAATEAHRHSQDPDRQMNTCPDCLGDEVVEVRQARRIARRLGLQMLALTPARRAGVNTPR